MRPIKFRAWDKLLKIMSRIETVRFEATESPAGAFLMDCGKTEEQFLEGGKLYVPGCVGQFCPMKDIELMQFTGLFDKSGKEIWEGDIIGYVGTTCVHNAVVVFEEGMFGVTDDNQPIYPLGKLVCSGVFAGSPIDLEVLGNIYENPTLLQETK